MNLLKISANNFRNLADDSEISFVARARKTSEDKEYELQEIDDNLYVYTTMAFVGKNASGKTTALDLIKLSYDILSTFRVEDAFSVSGTKLCIFFYHEGYIYKYVTELVQKNLDKSVCFSNEYIGKKKYFSSYSNRIFEDNFEPIVIDASLPEDVSSVFFVLRNRLVGEIKYDDGIFCEALYDTSFRIKEALGIDDGVLKKILAVFDENIKDLRRDKQGNYVLKYNDEVRKLTSLELFRIMSSGTTKGILLYLTVIASLKKGFTVIIDEIENHFHKTLVENIISLYKDKTVNKKNAMLIFSTHYCELLDLFNRQDNIYVANADDKVHLNSIYDKYGSRNDILKSKRFYSGEFRTSVNYDALMELKKVLK